MQQIKSLLTYLSKRPKKEFSGFTPLFLILIGLIIVPLVVLASFMIAYRGRIYPNVRLVNLDLSGYAFGEAVAASDTLQREYLLNSQIYIQIPDELTISSTTSAIPVDFKSHNLNFNPRDTVRQAYLIGRQASFTNNLNHIIKLLKNSANVTHKYSIDEELLDLLLDDLAKNFDQPGVATTITTDTKDPSQIVVNPGQDGIAIDRQKLKKDILTSLATLSTQPIQATTQVDSQTVSTEEISQTQKRAAALITKEVQLIFEATGYATKRWQLSGEDIVGFLDFKNDYNEGRIQEYLTNLSESVNHQPQNALFEFENGRVTEFAPGLDGITLNEEQTKIRMINAFQELETDKQADPLYLSLNTVVPNISTNEVNDLGIKELLGQGDSDFKGSIPGRVHNVALTASRLHGILIAPHENFSFNEAIGEVSRKTGYQSAYVISGGRTVLGDGGGVCQDSTTLFRAAMDAGLPILQRKPHSYRVGYYEQNSKPGFDATVYSPSVDFVFTNDTDHHILIQAHADKVNQHLTIQLFGTNDGRVAEISNYQQWDAVPAPPPLYQDDPTLPSGTVKQVDWAASGLKVKFDYKVTKNDQPHFDKTFYSTYRPWQAVYLKGTG